MRCYLASVSTRPPGVATGSLGYVQNEWCSSTTHNNNSESSASLKTLTVPFKNFICT